MKKRELMAWLLTLFLTAVVVELYFEKERRSIGEAPTTDEVKVQEENKYEAEIRRREIEADQREFEKKLEEMVAAEKRVFQDTVEKCAVSVRVRSDAKTFKGLSRFDAYVSDSEKSLVSFFGTDDERFQFEKCMTKNNQPLNK
jgi:hypothetical protein